MSESFFTGIDLQIHKVTGVRAKLAERRDCERAMDHDVYELLITSELLGGEGEASIRLVLYTEPAADIGLDALVLDDEEDALDEALDVAEKCVEALPTDAEILAAELERLWDLSDAPPCSERYGRVLRSAGLRTDLSRTEATQAILSLVNAGYRVTPEIKARWGVDGD